MSRIGVCEVCSFLLSIDKRIEEFVEDHLKSQDYYYGFTPLHIAVIRRDGQSLHTMPAYLDSYDINFRTPSHLAIELNDFAIEAELTRLGCNSEKKDGCGYTPLMYAVICSSVDFKSAASELSTRVDDVNVDSNICRHYTASDDVLTRMTDFLLYYGADPRIRNSKGLTFLDSINNDSLPNQVAFLLAHVKSSIARFHVEREQEETRAESLQLFNALTRFLSFRQLLLFKVLFIVRCNKGA